MKTSAPENEKNPELSLTANEPAIKRIKIEDSSEDDVPICPESVSWVQCGDQSLSVGDRNVLRSGDDLSDKHINFG